MRFSPICKNLHLNGLSPPPAMLCDVYTLGSKHLLTYPSGIILAIHQVKLTNWWESNDAFIYRCAPLFLVPLPSGEARRGIFFPTSNVRGCLWPSSLFIAYSVIYSYQKLLFVYVHMCECGSVHICMCVCMCVYSPLKIYTCKNRNWLFINQITYFNNTLWFSRSQWYTAASS